MYWISGKRKGRKTRKTTTTKRKETENYKECMINYFTSIIKFGVGLGGQERTERDFRNLGSKPPIHIL